MPFWWRRKKQAQQGMPSIPKLMEALAAAGIPTTPDEFSALAEQSLQASDVRRCLPEETHSILLERTASGYRVTIPFTLAGHPAVLAGALAAARLFAAASELARARGVAKYVLEPEERIAVCGPDYDLRWRPAHPILTLLPGLQISL
jgi:hypothetical protein